MALVSTEPTLLRFCVQVLRQVLRPAQRRISLCPTRLWVARNSGSALVPNKEFTSPATVASFSTQAATAAISPARPIAKAAQPLQDLPQLPPRVHHPRPPPPLLLHLQHQATVEFQAQGYVSEYGTYTTDVMQSVACQNELGK